MNLDVKDSNQSQRIGPLDLTNEINTFDESFEESLVDEKPYDPRPQEDTARRRITYILLVILSFVVLWALLIVTFCPNSKDNILEVVQTILSPIIPLVSAAIGFYFGANNR